MHTILRTRFAAMSAARPASALPALLFTMVRLRAPCAINVSMSAEGMPALPKPPIMMVAPSGMSASAASGEAKILLIMGRRIIAPPFSSDSTSTCVYK
jgi:hypothetical protein